MAKSHATFSPDPQESSAQQVVHSPVAFSSDPPESSHFPRQAADTWTEEQVDRGTCQENLEIIITRVGDNYKNIGSLGRANTFGILKQFYRTLVRETSEMFLPSACHSSFIRPHFHIYFVQLPLLIDAQCDFSKRLKIM